MKYLAYALIGLGVVIPLGITVVILLNPQDRQIVDFDLGATISRWSPFLLLIPLGLLLLGIQKLKSKLKIS